MIKTVEYEQILNIWELYLWPERTSKIESHSAMLIYGAIDIHNFEYPATYFVYTVDDIIAGCNSGHMCNDNSYRSRGLYVFPRYRNQGIGSRLLNATILQGQKENADFVWSYPKKKSWSTYENVGFSLASDWEQSELGLNAYSKLELNTTHPRF